MLGGFASGDSDLMAYARLYAHPFRVLGGPAARLCRGHDDGGGDRGEGDRTPRTSRANAAYFRSALQSLESTPGRSTRTSCQSFFATAISSTSPDYSCAERGLYLVPIDYPAVRRMRSAFGPRCPAAHTKEDLDTRSI